MRLAYADPPYPGQAKRHYGDHPDYAGEVDQAALVEQLGSYDGWALHTSAAALQAVLAICPAGVRLGVWYKPNAAPPIPQANWWWTWEPVIVKPARQPAAATKDCLIFHKEQGFLGATIVGQKPGLVCQWVFALMGADADDTLADLFPGSGAVTKAWVAWRAQLRLDMRAVLG